MSKNEDENGGHGHIEHAEFGNVIIHVFYSDDNEVIRNIHENADLLVDKNK